MLLFTTGKSRSPPFPELRLGDDRPYSPAYQHRQRLFEEAWV